MDIEQIREYCLSKNKATESFKQDIEEARQAVAELADDERVTIVARVILPGTEEWLAENSRGSLCLKAPNDVLRERRKRRRSNGGGA